MIIDKLLDIFVGRKELVGVDNQLVRDQWLQHVIESLPPGSRILDAGAGELKYKKYCGHLKYVSQDFAQYNGQGDGTALQTGKWDQSHLDFISDIKYAPLGDHSFDAVMCVEVIEHIPDPINSIKELMRLVKPGGYLIITAPFNSLTHFAPFFFHTGFSKYFYEYWLEKFGANILDLQINGNYFEYFGQELHRLIPVMHQYTNTRVKWIEAVAVNILLRALARASRHDHGSNELIGYGIHVFAQKQMDGSSS